MNTQFDPDAALAKCTADQMLDFIEKNGIFIASNREHSVLCAAAHNHDPAVMAVVLAAGLRTTDICATCGPLARTLVLRNRDLRVLGCAIAAGADPNCALDVAARQYSPDKLFLLLSSPTVNVHHKLHFGNEAIHYAMESWTAGALAYLLRCGANPNATNDNGETPLFRMQPNDCQRMQLLVQAGADINAVTHSGETLAHRLIALGIDNSFRSALELGLGIEGADYDNHLPWESWFDAYFHHQHAADESSMVILRTLYMTGAKIDRAKVIDYFDSAVRRNEPLPILMFVIWLGLASGFTDRDRQCSFVKKFERDSYNIIRYYDNDIIAVCQSLQGLRLPTLVLCEIIQEMYSFLPRLRLCDIWARVKLVRHFQK